MSHAQQMIALATLLGALGMWLMLPRRIPWGRAAGAVFGLVSLGLFASQVAPLAGRLNLIVFWILATVTVASAAAAVTFRSPVYCAIWFALSLLGTAALFLFQGAQFLGVATIVVYAGAILVTFLFVLMLAQPRGQAFYDRLSWEAALSAAGGAVMIGVLTVTVAGVLHPTDITDVNTSEALAADKADRVKTLTNQHMAHLGGQLFSRHLVAVEVAGTLLLVALVAAVAIVAETKRSPPVPVAREAASHE